MALTITLDLVKKERIGRRLYLISGTIDFDDSYPTGGESVAGVTKYFKNCLRLICDQKDGYIFEFDKANKKLKAYYPTNLAVAGGAATAGTDALSIKSGVLNQESSGADNAPSVGLEVPNTTDLSGLTGVSFIAIGL